MLFNVVEDREAVPIDASSLELVDSEVPAGESSGDAFSMTWRTHTMVLCPGSLYRTSPCSTSLNCGVASCLHLHPYPGHFPNPEQLRRLYLSLEAAHSPWLAEHGAADHHPPATREDNSVMPFMLPSSPRAQPRIEFYRIHIFMQPLPLP